MFFMSRHVGGGSHRPPATATPSSGMSGHWLHWGGNNKNHLAPGGCEVAHSLPSAPVFVVEIDLTDRGCSLEVLIPAGLTHPQTHADTHARTADKPHPFYANTPSPASALTLHTPCSVPAWLQWRAHSALGLTPPSADGLLLVSESQRSPTDPQQDGELHVMCPPA